MAGTIHIHFTDIINVHVILKANFTHPNAMTSLLKINKHFKSFLNVCITLFYLGLYK